MKALIVLMMVLFSCGKSDSDLKIIGGKPTHKRFFVMLMTERGGQKFKGPCGATLVASRYAITAGHCVSSFWPNDLRDKLDYGYIGAYKPWSKNGGKPYEILKIKKIYEHPDHMVGDDRGSDLAIIEFESPSSARPIGMKSFDLEDGDKLKTYGFGQTSEGGATSKELLKVKVSYSDCDSYGSSIDDTMFCAGGDGLGDSCGGDSGGPIIHDHKLVGVVSWGKGCNRKGYPGVYAKLDMEWIESIISEDI